MTRHLFTFLGTFVAGALLALVTRAAWFEPHADHSTSSVVAPAQEAHNAAVDPQPVASPAAHTTHATSPVATVNTVCPICGMEVDPDLGSAEYQGRKIGFGCRACPAKFKAAPEKYGPAALRNEVVKG